MLQHQGRPAARALEFLPELLVLVALAVGCSFALLTSTQNTIAELAGIVCALGVAVLTILGGAAILTTSRPPHSSEEAK